MLHKWRRETIFSSSTSQLSMYGVPQIAFSSGLAFDKTIGPVAAVSVGCEHDATMPRKDEL